MRLRGSRHIDGLERGERVLATAGGADGEVVATSYRLILPGVDGAAVEWSQIETATWNGEDEMLAVTQVADESGRQRRHRIVIHEPGRLVDVVREQVNASVVISRRFAIDGRRGIRVTGRRTPRGEIVWAVVLDAGIDLNDPATRERVDSAVALVRNEVE